MATLAKKVSYIEITIQIIKQNNIRRVKQKNKESRQQP